METKHPLASKTIWGAIITVIGLLLQQFGVDVSGLQQADLAGALATVAGVVLTVYGRFRASGKISAGSGTASMFVALILAGAVSACAVSKAETPAQQVYAYEVEYQNVARSIIAYGTSSIARPDVVQHLKRLEQVAYDALTAARAAVRSGDNVTLNAALTAGYSALNQAIAYLKEKGAFNVTDCTCDHPGLDRGGTAWRRPGPALHVGTG